MEVEYIEGRMRRDLYGQVYIKLCFYLQYKDKDLIIVNLIINSIQKSDTVKIHEYCNYSNYSKIKGK